jgi:hypothetical protein
VPDELEAGCIRRDRSAALGTDERAERSAGLGQPERPDEIQAPRVVGRAVPLRGDPDHAPAQVVIAAETNGLLLEEPREPPAHVAEPDEQEVEVDHGSERAQEIREAIEAVAQVPGLAAEADAEVAVHAEVIAGHDQDALLDAQAIHELG